VIERSPRRVFVTGASGYIGTALSRALIARGHSVDGLCRMSSKTKLARGVRPIVGDPLEANS
jgi:nucleoside-diphosphate-sugar epimerase